MEQDGQDTSTQFIGRFLEIDALVQTWFSEAAAV